MVPSEQGMLSAHRAQRRSERPSGPRSQPDHTSGMTRRQASEEQAKRRLSGVKRKTGPGLAFEALGVLPSERLARGTHPLRTPVQSRTTFARQKPLLSTLITEQAMTPDVS